MPGDYNPIRKEVYQMAGNYRPAKTNVPRSNVPSSANIRGNVPPSGSRVGINPPGKGPIPNKDKAAARLKVGQPSKGNISIQPWKPGGKILPPKKQAIDNLKKKYSSL